jgi:hypothetical protein
MSSFKEEHKKEIDALLKISQQNLIDAKALLKSGGYRSAISRAYYMFLDLAKAALLTEGIIIKSHAGAVTKFGETFVKPGLIKGDYGRAFRRALEIRFEADYEALHEFTKEEAEETVKEAEKFFKELKNKIFS